MVGKRYELFKIIKPNLCLEDGKIVLAADVPESVKKAFEEYSKMPAE